MLSNNCSPVERFTAAVTKWTGSTSGIVTATGLMAVWAIYGYLAHYSEASQMVLNTVTSIITFIMLFLIQKSGNKSDKATQLKLDEIIYSLKETDSSRAAVEELSEEELDLLKDKYRGE